MPDAPAILLVDDNVELVDLLGQVLEEAGYRVRPFHRGKPALESIAADPPALGIVDLLLPDIMGYEVGKALAAKDVPYVFVTGVFKGGRHALDAARKHGSRGYFEKPFDTEKLLEAIGKLLPPTAARRKSAGLEVELDIDVDEPDPLADPLEMTGKIAVSGERISAVLTGSDFALKPAEPSSTWIREPPERRPPPLPRTTPGPAARATPPPLPAMAPVAAPVTPGPAAERISADGRIRRGQLHDNLPQLIGAFWQARGNGELGLQRGKVKKVIYFQEGRPVFALSNLAADRFGSFLVRVGKIDEAQLREAALRAGATGRRTGDVLIELGLLKDAERMYYVAQQVKAIIYSLFAWEEGEYVLSFQDRAKHEPIQLGVHPSHLISRGIKKLYRKERLERLIALEDRPIPAADPMFQLVELELEPWEAQLLARVTGERNVAELIALAGKPPHMVYASLAALLGCKVVEKRYE